MRRIAAARGRAAAALLAAGLLLAACTRSSTSSGSAPSASAGSAAPAAGRPIVSAQPNPLCDYPAPSTAAPPSPAALPGYVQRIAGQVEQVRDLKFVHPVAPEPVTQEQLNESLRSQVEQQLPKDLVDGEGQAWMTIGVIPRGTDLRAALLDYYGSQILGYYDTNTQRLVFVGSSTPNAYQQFVLSHELTHALDDQRLRFGPLADDLQQTCQDERSSAFTALIEGDAVSNSVRWAQRFLTQDQLGQLNQEATEGSPPPATIPSFVLSLQSFPYTAGLSFVRALEQRGGESAVDAAFRSPPLSTEQILHPSRYPSDRPIPVVVPDLSSHLGPQWRLIDQAQPGEDWLRLMLALHLPETQAESAAAGWGGAEYRAWSDGTHSAVLMKTVWDTAPDAGQFAAAVRSWLPQAGTMGEVETLDGTVSVLFASDAPTLQRLEAVTGAD
ncbi:MAG TPA: hypothetical protein VGH10_03755 [Actinomycetota bacterium]|jgi:hypothetical protein